MPDESSRRVRGENNLDCMGEIHFEPELPGYATLDSAFERASRDGYKLWDVRTANITHGGSDRNEPRAVIFLRIDNDGSLAEFEDKVYHARALITRDPNKNLYYFSTNWRPIA